MKKRLITLFMAGSACLLSFAQNVTVINHFAGDTTGRGTEGFELTRTGEIKVIVNYYEPVNDVQKSKLEAVVGAALDYYIEENIVRHGDKIELKKSASRMMKEMNEIVRSGVRFYDYREISEFKGFSEQISQKLQAVSNSSIPDYDLPEQEKLKMEQNYFAQTISEVEKMVNAEVGNYSKDNLVVYAGTEETFVDASTRERLLTELSEPFDPSKTLGSIDIYSDSEPGKNIPDMSYLPLRGQQKPAANGSFEEKVLEMLSNNNKKLDSMQGEIDDLRNEQNRLFKEKQDQTNSQLQAQINELRAMVVDLVRISAPTSLANEGGSVLLNSPSAPVDVVNLPSSVSIYFLKGSTTLDGVARLTLNEMVDILARNPGLKILITGYADKTGNEWNNLLISQERAAAVKRFFASSGLREDRFVMQYYGARDSQSANPSDRKVVLEFIR